MVGTRSADSAALRALGDHTGQDTVVCWRFLDTGAQLSSYLTCPYPIPSHAFCQPKHSGQSLQYEGERDVEGEIYSKVPTFLCGSTPATIGWLEGASPVRSLFLASVQFLCLASPRAEIVSMWGHFSRPLD